MVDLTDNERAVAYVQDMVWRLETYQSRARYNTRTGRLKRLPTRVRRFCNGIPQDNVAPVLAALESMAPYRGVVYNGEDDQENEYRPTVTMIRKDDSLKTGADPTYTIIQDLLLVSEPDFYAAGDASSCSRLTTSDYYWDEPDVIDCPAGEQGVSWQVANVQKSSETDLFSYQLRKSVAITQHMPAAVSACDETSVVTVETWDNAYGQPGGFRWDPFVHDGAPIQIPAPCSQPVGTTVQVRYDENPDCTFKVTVEKTVSKVMDGAEYMRVRDQYRREAMDLVSRARTPLSKAGVEYDGGVVTRYETRENGDGTFENRVTVTTEREVRTSTYSRSVMPYNTRVEVTDTNVVEPASGLLPGYRYGSFKSTKTPGGLYVNEYVGIERIRMDMGLDCRQTIFQHDHGWTESVAEMPGRDTDVRQASGGLIHEARYRVDGQGSIIHDERTTQELKVERSEESTTVTPYGRTTEWTDTNMPTRASSVPSGYDFGRYQSQRTPGGLYINRYSGFVRRAGDVGSGCKQTIFQHDHRKETSLKSVPSGDLHVATAANGLIHEADVRVSDDGRVVRTEQTTRELKVESSTESVTITPRMKVTRRTDTNMPTRASGLLPGAKYGSYQFQKTPGGLFVNEYQSYDVTTGTSARSRFRDAFQEEHVDEETALDMAVIPDHVVDASGGVVHRMTGRMDDSTGIVTKVETTTTERRFDYADVTARRTLKAAMLRIVHRNTSDPASGLTESFALGMATGRTEERQTNPGRTTNVTITKVVPIEGARLAEACQMTIHQHLHRVATVLGEDSDMKPGSAEVVEASGGVFITEEVRQDDDGIKTAERTRTKELNHEFGSRTHEDAIQAYQVIEHTSDAVNYGDPEHISPEFSALEDNSQPGSASRVDRPKTIFNDKGSNAKGDSDENAGAHMDLEEQITTTRVIGKGGFERGKQIVSDSELTNGGMLHSKEYVYIAKPQKWKDYLHTEKYVFYQWTFRNLTQEQLTPLVQDVCSEAAKVNYGTFTVHPEITRNLNEFGLYDGHVGFTASSPLNGSTTGSHGSKVEPKPVKATKIVDWWEKREEIAPLDSLSPNTNAGVVPWFQITVLWTHWEYGWGLGEESFRNFVKAGADGTPNSFWNGTAFNYNTESGKYTYHKILETRKRVYITRGTSAVPEADGTDAEAVLEGYDSIGQNDKDKPEKSDKK